MTGMAENQAKSDVSKREEEVLVFWNKNKIFEKSVAKEAPKGEYAFYDGPPFATGTPHYGHIVASVIKDVVPRYFTMQGYRVPRQWGWDCHGLPIENIVEKELGSKHKKDILALGVGKFNELCRSKVLMYVDEWKKVIPRIGRWADMEQPYFTMSRDFMESVWWAFKQLYDKGLVYEDYRSMHICPRCETTLSQSEVTEGYKDVKDLAVTVKFKLTHPEKLGLSGDVYMLAWTTTPWTLPGNVALAVGVDIAYGIFSHESGDTLIARSDMEGVGTRRRSVMGAELVGLEYEPPFDYYIKDEKLKNRENGWKVYAADFVTAESGTGIAHEAPAFGADDWALLKKENLPFVQHVKMDGTFKPEVTDFAGMDVKPIDDVQATDVAVIKYLAGKGLLFAKEKVEHSYPHCWRCDTPLLNYATSSWFVKIEAQKDALLRNAKPINWSPAHIKEGRWGKWLEGARDWSISRQRFWASVIPLWRCEKCGEVRVFGSAKELEDACGKRVDDLHKHIVDEITLSCTCGGVMKRIPDVLDTWFDSGSMPYGQAHHPFSADAQGVTLREPKVSPLPENFPAQFIAEGQDQTRAWFYYLHVLATSIFNKNAFENVIVNGIVLAEDGKKMSKRLQNYPDPMYIVDKYGADALRLYLLASPVMQAENLNFSEKGVAEWKGVLTRLENVLSFYNLYKADLAHEPSRTSTHVLDRWILARLDELTAEVTNAMQSYNLTAAARPFAGFVDDLSTWYLRRSRDRISGEEGADKQAALATMLFVLREFAKVLAPFTPFIAERVWQEVKGSSGAESVHLTAWPETKETAPDASSIIPVMAEVREYVSLALEAREKAGIKVKQPLALLAVNKEFEPDLLDLVRDEVNVKDVRYDASLSTPVQLDTEISDDLRVEGIVRDLRRAVQQKRKELGLMPKDAATVTIRAVPETIEALRRHEDAFKKATKAVELVMSADGELEDSHEKLLIEVKRLEKQVSRAQLLSIALALVGGLVALLYGVFFK
jgi:isoleucyl-tRNA synthetase